MLIVLDRVQDYWAVMDSLAPVISAVALDYDVDIGWTLVSEGEFAAHQNAFVETIRRDLVAA